MWLSYPDISRIRNATEGFWSCVNPVIKISKRSMVILILYLYENCSFFHFYVKSVIWNTLACYRSPMYVVLKLNLMRRSNLRGGKYSSVLRDRHMRDIQEQSYWSLYFQRRSSRQEKIYDNVSTCNHFAGMSR